MTTDTQLTPTDPEIAALRSEFGITSNGRGIKEFTQVRDFARAVLARWGQPAHSGEPVAFAFQYDDGTWHDPSTTEHSSGMRPVFAAPQPVEREPLPVSQIRDWWASENGLEDCEMCKLTDFLRVVRAVEEKHGIKGGQHGAE